MWLLLCGIILLPIWPFVSQTRLQWLLLVAFGPPLYAIGDHLGAHLFSKRVGSKISQQKSSILRILFAVFVMVTLYAIAIVTARLAGLFN